MLSCKGLIAGDVFRITQACSDSDVFFTSLQRRFAYWSDEVLMPIQFALHQLVDILDGRMSWLVIRFNWHNEPATLAAADTFFKRLLISVHPMVGLVTDSARIATREYTKLLESLLQYHGLQRYQYPAISPDFALELRSPFSAHCRTIRSMFELHLLSTTDSDLDAEDTDHLDYKRQKHSLAQAQSNPFLALRNPVYPPLAYTRAHLPGQSHMRRIHKSLKRPHPDSPTSSPSALTDEDCD
jgi:hypothetical protein